jgi:hypothetical protein
MTNCRCKYPTKQRVGDDGKGNRLLYCELHGFSLRRVPRYAQPEGLFLAIPKKVQRGK